MKINENILLQLCNAAITAGNRVLDFYELDTEIIYKEDIKGSDSFGTFRM